MTRLVLGGRGMVQRLPIALTVVVLAAVVGSGCTGSGGTAKRGPAAAKPGQLEFVRFQRLARSNSNRCDLQPSQLSTMPDSMTLDGACCSPMDLSHYLDQRQGLRSFAAYPELPTDPNSISAALAKRLMSYGAITLNAAQQHTYQQATALAHEHGPCCCHCWRWAAFEGQAKELIVVRHFNAAQVARVWDLEDGCGGK